MRQEIYGDWSLDVDAEFAREETDDGFVFFRKPGFVISASLYREQSFDSEFAVRDCLGISHEISPDYSFRSNSEGIAAGQSHLTS